MLHHSGGVNKYFAVERRNLSVAGNGGLRIGEHKPAQPLVKNNSAKSQLRRPTHSSRERSGVSAIIDPRVRASIDAKLMINALSEHVKGKRKMRATQVRAALGLLAKVLPDLQTIDLAAQLTVRHVVRDTPLSADEFARQFCEQPTLDLKPN